MSDCLRIVLAVVSVLLGGVALPCPAAPANEDDLGFTFYIREYRVSGATKLTPLQIEKAVYPHLGPHRTPADVERARMGLEAAYRDAGYQTVSVLIPQQDPSTGVIRLEVAEGAVSRLRVRGARYYSPSAIRAAASSVAEGAVPNMNDVRREILALNRQADRRVIPELRPGAEPGTFEVDLTVEDELPLHGTLELNNRYSPNTSELRLNGMISYANVFQLGHAAGLGFQVAPENTDDAMVFTGYYLARVSDRASLMFTATRQDSDISTLGGGAVAGRGNIAGVRAIIDLPGREGFHQTFSVGIDYKDFKEDLSVGGAVIAAPIQYYPITASYGATWLHGETAFTELNAGLIFNLRSMGSGTQAYANKRYNADGAFIILRGDLSHTKDTACGAQWYGKIQGQLANKPLISSEQFSGGGLGSARGYLESTALGDNAVFVTAELRSRSLTGSPTGKAKDGGPNDDELRVHLFADGGVLGIYDALPGQKDTRGFASVGLGARARHRGMFQSSLDVALPLTTMDPVERGDVRVTFRSWLDF
jgi:hemolysin activation/secretion protein